MLYVQQSLNPGEEILMGARFHWMYTLQAVFWIIFGLAAAILIGYGGVWWEVDQVIGKRYGDLPAEHYDQAWKEIVREKGGYLKIIWNLNIIMRGAILLSFVMGVFFFAHMMVVKATTEIAVTTERLVYKKGLVARHVGEIAVDRVEGVSVRQGALARIFGYGIVCIRGMGVGEVALPPIEAPVEFRKAVNEAKMIHEKNAIAKAGGIVKAS